MNNDFTIKNFLKVLLCAIPTAILLWAVIVLLFITF